MIIFEAANIGGCTAFHCIATVTVSVQPIAVCLFPETGTIKV